jgi:hypothetical protein
MNLNSDVASGNSTSPRAEADAVSASPVSVQGERKVLQRVYQRCGHFILEACTLSLLPPEFLGALTANESAGAARAARFEPAVYRRLQAVACGESPSYGSLRAADLDAKAEETLAPPGDGQPQTEGQAKSDGFHARYLTSGFLQQNRTAIAALEDDVLRQLATSWGYTQIMGYHTIGRTGTVQELLDPTFHYKLAIELLERFAVDYHLDLKQEFEELFRCWNTGRPYGKTYDLAYVENGLRRMKVYRECAQSARS